MTVTAATMRETVAASGTLQPERSADLDFEVAGTVTDGVRRGGRPGPQGPGARPGRRRRAGRQPDRGRGRPCSRRGAARRRPGRRCVRHPARGRPGRGRWPPRRPWPRPSRPPPTPPCGRASPAPWCPSTSPSATSSATPRLPRPPTARPPSAVQVVSTGRFVVDATVASADVARLKEGLQAEITPVGATDTGLRDGRGGRPGGRDQLQRCRGLPGHDRGHRPAAATCTPAPRRTPRSWSSRSRTC